MVSLYVSLKASGPSLQDDFQMVGSQRVQVYMVVPSQVQNFTFLHAEDHEIPLCLVPNLLGSLSTTIWPINHSWQFFVRCKLNWKCTLSMIMAINEYVKLTCPRYNPCTNYCVTNPWPDFIPLIITSEPRSTDSFQFTSLFFNLCSLASIQ